MVRANILLARVTHIVMPSCSEGGKRNPTYQNHGFSESTNDYLRDNLTKSLK